MCFVWGGGRRGVFIKLVGWRDRSATMAIPALPYTIERILTRQIAKFGVEGSEYWLRVEPINDDIPYVTAVDMIHDMFDRE